MPRLVVFSATRERFAIAIDAAERVVRMVTIAPLPGAPTVVIGAVNVGGEILPVVDVGRRLGLPPRPFGPDSHLILAHTSRRRLVLAVDAVLGVVEVPAGSISTAAVLPGGPIAGAVGLPDGIVFIQDLDRFLGTDEESRLDQALGGQA